jgi:hypothetical protein
MLTPPPDLEFSYEKIMDYYALRSHIEFRLRRPEFQTVLETGRLSERQRSRTDQCRQPIVLYGEFQLHSVAAAS